MFKLLITLTNLLYETSSNSNSNYGLVVLTATLWGKITKVYINFVFIHNFDYSNDFFKNQALLEFIIDTIKFYTTLFI